MQDFTARLEGNAAKITEKRETCFQDIDHWLEKASRAKLEEQKDALKKAYVNVRKSFEDGLRAEGVTDFEIKPGDTNAKKICKAVLLYEDA